VKRNVELRQERKRIANEMAELAERGLSTSEMQERFNRLDKEQEKLKAQIDLIEGAAEAAYRSGTVMGERSALAMGDRIATTYSPVQFANGHTSADAEYKSVFRRYLRYGAGEMAQAEREILYAGRDIDTRATVGTEGTPFGGAYPSSTSGFFTPVSFVDNVERQMQYYGPMVNGECVKIASTATGAPMMYPTSSDVSVVAEMTAENTQVEAANVNIGQVQFGSYKFDSKIVLVSIEVLQDSGIDIEEFLTETFADRFGRGLNSYFTTGTGTNQPTGVVTAAVAGGLNYTFVGSDSNDGTGAANTIGTDDLVHLEHAVDPVYRIGASYMMHDSTLAQLKYLKDKYGRPIWQPSILSGNPDQINGYPYWSNPYMAQLQANASSPAVTNHTMLFGNFKKFVVRRVKDMTILRLSERYADYGQVGFLSFARYDSNLIQAAALAVGNTVY
jgi:HK97 family phage major capsid protein